MAEFGENVRRLREARGLTQQSLADELYVTRQAVSRWEGGSRYPDLMTAKKLATALGSSMDALLSDEDMKQYAEKAPVLESPVARGAQTAVLAFGFAAYLVLLLWYAMGLGALFSPETDFRASVIVVGRMLMAGLFGFGTLASIKDRLSPRVAVMIAGLYFGLSALNHVFSGLAIMEASGQDGIFLIGVAVAVMTCGAVCAWYIGRGGRRGPLPVYIVCGASATLRLANAIYTVVMSADNEFISTIYSNTIVGTLAELATLALLCVMARTLYRKRRQAMMNAPATGSRG